MTIGINAAAAVRQPRTGVEEYTYQLLKYLAMLPDAQEHRFFLYLPSFAKASEGEPARKIPPRRFLEKNGASPLYKGGLGGIFDFPLPANFEVKVLRWPLPFLWTQVRLVWKMIVSPPDILFIPVHILPFFSPENSVVTVHGLEYEYFPQDYSFWRRFYLRWATKSALRRAKKIIAVSQNTKDDLIKLYGASPERIEVVHHGVEITPPFKKGGGEGFFKKSPLIPLSKGGKYLLYLGRLETKKNIQGILEAYNILKERYQIPHQLILAGTQGYGYKNLKFKVKSSKFKDNIIETGYINEDEKWILFQNADVFLFPSFYEGFGLPILEAQVAGAPVVTSFCSSMPEVAGEGALFVNPQNPAQIAEAVFKIIDDIDLRDRLKQLGRENVRRFSWENCAKKTLKIVLNLYEGSFSA